MNNESLPDRASTPDLPKADDAELMRHIIGHDRAAFEELYWRYAPLVLHYLSSFFAQPELAEEALNDIMLILWQKAAQFDPSRRLNTWLLGIARLQALMVLRRTRAKMEFAPVSPIDITLNPKALATQNELHQAMAKALATLPIVQREVVELAFYHGLSYREISIVLGCPVGTVKTRMMKARQLLRPLLASRS